jgi:hypothetical protein
MEFVGGLACLVLGVLGLWAGVRGSRRVRTGVLVAAVTVEAAVVVTLFLDWGYSWIEQTALETAIRQNVWIALPHAVALLALAVLAVWGRAAIVAAAVLAAFQAALLPVVMYLVGRNVDQSFLAAAPLAALYLSVLAAFLLIPEACRSVPAPGTHWHRVAFGPRQGLLDAIAELHGLGLSPRAPASVLESGGAAGAIGDVRVRVSSEPELLPPGYALRVTTRRPAADVAFLPARPGFAPRESLSVDGGEVTYLGVSPAGFDVTPERLRDFVRELASA